MADRKKRVSPQESVEGPSKGIAPRQKTQEKKAKEGRGLNKSQRTITFPTGFIPKRKRFKGKVKGNSE